MSVFEATESHWAVLSSGCAVGLSAGLFLQALRSSERLRTLHRQGKCAAMLDMVAARAWKDAALQLLVLGAPDWSLARLCRDDALWYCTLSRYPGLPHWLDDAIERQHPSADTALVSAVLEALDGSLDAIRRRDWRR